MDGAGVQALQAAGEKNDRGDAAREDIAQLRFQERTLRLGADFPRVSEPEGRETGPVHPPRAAVTAANGDEPPLVIEPPLPRGPRRSGPRRGGSDAKRRDRARARRHLPRPPPFDEAQRPCEAA